LLEQVTSDDARLESEPGIEVRLQRAGQSNSNMNARRVLLVVRKAGSTERDLDWMRRARKSGDCVYVCTPRGVDGTKWTRKDPPNYIERSHVLLGRTVDTGRVWDVIAIARYLRGKYDEDVPVYVLGEGPAGVLAAYAALWEQDISGVTMNEPPLSHMEAGAPQFLNVLRVCDIPDVLGMLAPRELNVYVKRAEMLGKVAEIYGAAKASAKFVRE
jgi:hypothetical protein